MTERSTTGDAAGDARPAGTPGATEARPHDTRHPGSPMPPPTTKRLQQDERARREDGTHGGNARIPGASGDQAAEHRNDDRRAPERDALERDAFEREAERRARGDTTRDHADARADSRAVEPGRSREDTLRDGTKPDHGKADHEKSAADLEREVERERAALRATLDEIRSSLSPGQLLDQALEYARHSGGREFAENLGRSVRDNPLPILLAGTGIAWLMATGAQRGRTSDSRTGQADSAGGRLGHAAASAGRRLDAASDAASGMAAAAHDRVTHAGQAAGEGVRDAAQHAAALAHDARDRVHQAGEQLRHAGDRVRHAGDRARQGWTRLVEEQPLVVGAVGIAVGAAIAAALPSTRTEDRLMGEASDAVKRGMRETAGEQLRHAGEIAGETDREVRDDLRERGLSADAATSAAEKVHGAGERLVGDGEPRGVGMAGPSAGGPGHEGPGHEGPEHKGPGHGRPGGHDGAKR